ncbi:MAG: magnesium transporter [Planctomycetales bacterium]
MLGKLALPEVREMIEERDLETLGEVANTWLAADLAALMTDLSDAEGLLFFQQLKPPRRTQTFEYLALDSQCHLLQELQDSEAASVLDEMAPDDRTALLEELPPEMGQRLLDLLTPEQKAIALNLLSYHEGSIARLMTPDFIAVEKTWSVKHVLDHVRTHGKDSETLNVIYIIDAQHKLVDDLRIRELLVAPLHAHISDLMDNRFVALKTTDDKRTAVDLFRKYDRTALPVVDFSGKLVGIITIDDVIDIAEESATREMQKLGGLEALDEPYVATPLMTMVKKRATWLVILFLGELLTATAMGYFEAEIAKAVVLALFVPLIISSGGNSGSQAATLIVRALALGEIKLRDWKMVLKRELASGLMLGLILGAIGFLRIAIWSSFSNIYGPHWGLIAATVAASLVGIVLWGTVAGSMLPLILKRCGLDPAASSAPFVATLVDVTGLIIYFSMALMILRGTML